MKFELKIFNRNVPDEKIIEDIRRVGEILCKDKLTQREYQQYGRLSPSTVRHRFGSWNNALSLAGLTSPHKCKIAAQDCLEDLRRVAEKLGKESVTIEEYKQHGKFSFAPFKRHFGNWLVALGKAGLKQTFNPHISDEEYFENLEQIWVKLGRQPRYLEIKKPFSKYSAGAYDNRFGSWSKALEAFVVYVNQGDEPRRKSNKSSVKTVDDMESTSHTSKEPNNIQPKTSRAPSWRLCFLVMRRDNFKCRICGRSPANTSGVILHIDHIVPWSKGGETIFDNLQTLCEKCNLGKSNLPLYENYNG